jgi:hypothetical protein
MRSLVYRLAPSAIVATALAWCCWPYLDSGAPIVDPQGPASLPVIELDQLHREEETGCERDPFRPLLAVARMFETVSAASGDTPAGEPAAETPPPIDPAKVIQRLTLDATLIRGARRRTIIDGKAYAQGDRLVASGGKSEPFLIGLIAAHQVMIEHRGKLYALRYRDRPLQSHPTSPENAPLMTPTADPNPKS